MPVRYFPGTAVYLSLALVCILHLPVFAATDDTFCLEPPEKNGLCNVTLDEKKINADNAPYIFSQVSDNLKAHIIRIGQQAFAFEDFFTDTDQNRSNAIIVFDKGQQNLILDLTTNQLQIIRRLPDGNVRNVMEGAADIRRKTHSVYFSAQLSGPEAEEPVPVGFELDDVFFLLGDTTTELVNDTIVVKGTVGTKTYLDIYRIKRDHPNVNAVLLQKLHAPIRHYIDALITGLIRKNNLTVTVDDTDYNAASISSAGLWGRGTK